MRLGLVLVLALLVLDLDDEAGRQVGDADGRVGRVDRLAAGPGRALDVDPQVRSSSISISTSSASGRTTTVAVEVWIRPDDSVAGTRWTRWTPPSNLSRL